MMSFNFFVTHVPIEQLVNHAHIQSARTSNIQKSRATWKIDNELKRRVKENKSKDRLEKVLRTNAANLKKRVDDVHNSHKEKMEAIEQFQKKQEFQMRKKQKETDERRKKETEMRDQRLAEVNAKRLAEIKAGIDRMKKNQERVKEHHIRQASAE